MRLLSRHRGQDNEGVGLRDVTVFLVRLLTVATRRRRLIPDRGWGIGPNQ
jgi:hypothetical protein